MNRKQIIAQLPYGPSFLFVDELHHVDEEGVKGTFTYREELFFYKGHFQSSPVTPAVILTETMAQIGLVCLGIYLFGDNISEKQIAVAMTSNAIDFLKPVFPGEKVTVTSEKVYFRFNKLNCRVKMENSMGEVVCKGTISGMIVKKPYEK